MNFPNRGRLMDQVSEFFSQGAEKTWQWFVHMPYWGYIVMIALALVTAYLVWSFFRNDPDEAAEVPDFPEEITLPEE